VVYYGLDLPEGRFDRPPESADSISCRRCGALLAYERVYYGHLGHYRCLRCGWTRPQPQVVGRAVTPHGLEGLQLAASVVGNLVDVELRVPGLYNAYNALAALAGAHALGIDGARAASALATVPAAFGRAECLQVGGHDVWLLLVKNPTGCDEVLRLLADLPDPLDLLAVLNDNAADGHDVSWIWDAAFEELDGRVRTLRSAGTRAEDMALRFKYAGRAVEPDAITPDPLTALDAALATTPQGSPLYVVATYTAMLELRRGLVARGLIKSYLERE
jgi:UDP-N-acetylmuramyl tripeptide synthase